MPITFPGLPPSSPTSSNNNGNNNDDNNTLETTEASVVGGNGNGNGNGGFESRGLSSDGIEVTQSTADRLQQTQQTLSRRVFISRHRKVLDRIATDSAKARRHSVPSEQFDNSSHAGSDRGGNGGSGTTSATKKCCAKFTKKCRKALQNKSTAMDWAETLVPAIRWLKTYQWKTTLLQDLIAGCTVGVMIIPQSMSYAKLAGLPVEYGLYSALVPVYAYSLFGSSRQLAVGPVALISLMLSSGLSHIMASMGYDNAADSAEYQAKYVQLAIQCSMLVGCTYIFMGLARLGFVTIFLSHAVVSGFTAGAAVLIGMSQIKYIFGYEVERSDRLYETIIHLAERIDQFNWKTFIMGSGSILMLLMLKNIGKTYPRFKFVRALGPLTVTALTIILTVALNLDDRGVPIVRYIPKGLPSVTIHQWSPMEDFGRLYTVVISITIVGFMESIAIAKQLASKHKYEIDSSLELIGLGMANFMGGMFQSYPVTGSFSRSAVNHESGAQSGISAMVTATMVGFTLLLLTPIFEKMPLNVLAAIVISGVIGLFDYEEAIYLYKVHKFDFWVWMVACVCTMMLGAEIGLVVAVGVSLLIVIYESAYPHTAVLGRLPGTAVYRNVKQYPEAERYEQIVMVRIDAPMYFANAQNVRDKLRKYRLAAEAELADRENVDVKYLIMEFGPVSHIDTSALHILEDMVINYKSRGQQLCFSNPSLIVMERLVASGLADKVGREHFFTCMDDAVSWCLQEMDTEAMSIHESRHGDTAVAAIEEEPSDQFFDVEGGDLRPPSTAENTTDEASGEQTASEHLT